MKTRFPLVICCALLSATVFASMSSCRPETWFHLIGGNVSYEGLTADLEAIKEAGIGGIHLFHGQFGEAEAWDGVAEQIPCLSAKWDDLVAHVAGECERLGLSFKMQNCPGWSMSGGPWIAPSNAMRKLVYARRDVHGDETAVPDISVQEEYRDADSDWRDVAYVRFPTPLGDDERGGLIEPQSVETNGVVRTFRFAEPVTVRTIELPGPGDIMHRSWAYNPGTHVKLEALLSGGWKCVCDVDYPQGCWQDTVPFSLACDETSSATWRLTVASEHRLNPPSVKFRSAARLDNWEGLSAHVLRGQLKRPAPRQAEAAHVPSETVRVVNPGDALPCGAWTVLRVGHVNMKKKNGPAPKEATGWECDKLDPRGIEANFDGYIGRLLKGPLKDGKLNGIVVDSWECLRQTWTWRMAEYFRKANGYDVEPFMPALFGWVVGSPADTERFLLDWRRTVSDLVTRNYYGRMSELARENGLSAAYETAFGDVIPGDILEYWKHCDTPMCEFWQPYAPEGGHVGHPNFKPVRPCVSAAHVYGKRRVDCEAFTNCALTWDENFRVLKEQAVRHFARGVTHLVFHTFTHNPQTDGRRPGTSFGGFIGTPFVRGQTWWSFMRPFTDWTAECCAFLERGLPVVDVLRYLGDELDHKPDELEYFPEGFKNDYLNADVLFNRLDVVDGRFVLPDGMSYAAVWVPPSVTVLPKTRARLDELSAKGGRIVYGSADDAVAGLRPHIVSPSPLLWYHRRDGDADLFFVAAAEKGFKGEATFSTPRGEYTLSLDLAPFENSLLEFSADVVPSAQSAPFVPSISLDSWTLSFPPGWGAPERMELDRLVPWKDLPGVSEEGRAFSGTATYEASVELEAESVECGKRVAKRIVLDLGDVRDFARVYVNGREAAALWSEPYRCDIAPYAKAGKNEIRVEVTSTWFNRLAYDFGQPPEKRKTWTIWTARNVPCLKPGAALRPSGLLGPVRLQIHGSGETLYNGIVLPGAWPPSTSTTADAGPQPVPYLEPENIPAVIPIDVGRQLFVDDFLVATTDLKRVYGKPRKYEGNPVLKPETPWELNMPYNPMALPKGGGMWWDSGRNVFRLWYESGWCREICYAESRDGLKWERVNQDVVPGTNRILPKQRVDSWSVVPDPDAKDPDERWKLFSAFGGNPAKSEVYTSPDGIHWKNHHRTGLNEDRSTMFFNPFRRKWVFSLRSNWRGRSRNYVECDDFIKGADWHWPFPVGKPSWKDSAGFTNTVDCFRWLAADDRDVQENRKDENSNAQLYNFDAVAYESIMIGAFEVHWGPENNVCEKRGLPKITDIQFAYSRDGFHFSRPLREAAIASERWDAYGKKWDVGYVQPLSNICVVMKDELWFYYGAFGGDTKRLQPSDPAVPGSGNGSLNGMYSNGAMGVAFMRRDGFVAMTAEAENAGELLTRPVSYRGNRLFVNAAVPNGFVEAEMLDEKLNTLATFGKFRGDSTRVELKALSGSLESFAGSPVRFRFRVKGGGLYSFWVSDAPSGRSHGYLAGGGPGYAGLKDE